MGNVIVLVGFVFCYVIFLRLGNLFSWSCVYVIFISVLNLDYNNIVFFGFIKLVIFFVVFVCVMFNRVSKIKNILVIVKRFFCFSWLMIV